MHSQCHCSAICPSSRLRVSRGWTQAILELSTKAPTLFKIIHNSVVSRGLVRNKHKRGDAQYPGLCTAVGIILKECNREMCEVQSYISSALFFTKIHKKVCVCVCVYVCVCMCTCVCVCVCVYVSVNGVHK